MDLLLQVWGGLFYLINKICFSLAEGRPEKTKRALKLAGWLIYILGVPAWVIILVMKHNWIAASIEAGGLPAMILGLVTVYTRNKKPLTRLNTAASFLTYAAMISGLGYSIYDAEGLNSLSQLLEMGVMVGFLLGSYLLAKNRWAGWLFFMLMNGSMGLLMMLQDKPILALQQALSFCFVVYGLIGATKKKRGAAPHHR